MTHDGPRILIIEAVFYPDIAEDLRSGAMAALEEADARVERIWVPGVLEIPAALSMAIDAGENIKIADIMGDKWIDDVTLFGPVSRVRDKLEAWFEAGIHTPILVPSSVEGGQLKAFEEIVAAFGK